MAISASGLGSGLDVNSLVSQLMSAERVPLDRLKAKESSYNTKLTAYGTLKSAISTFQSSLKALSSSGLGALTATSSNTSILGVNATTSAAPGNYAIQVDKLAKEQKIAFAGLDSATTKLAPGSMHIQVGDKAPISIASGAYTLTELASAINGANAGVTATIINDGSKNADGTSTPYRLVLSANDTGTGNTISVSADGGLDQFDSSGPGMQEIQAAQDAVIKINNIVVTKPSNTITDAIPGLTLQLAKEDSGSTVNVAIGRDKNAVKTAITGFVSAYNTLDSTIANLTAYQADTNTGRTLTADQTTRSVLTSLRAEMGKASTGGAYTLLSEIGISFQRDGKLAADEVKLQKALDSNFADIAQLFSSETGYATRLTKLTDKLLASDGIIAARTNGLQASIKSIVASEEALELRLASTEKRLRAQYVALDSMLSSMQSTSNYLTQQLSALANNS